jgi:hypothetical protein
VFTDINPQDVTLVRQGNDLVVYISESAVGAGDAGSVLLKANFVISGGNGVERIVFANGTTWDRSAISSNLHSAVGTSSDDLVTNTSQNELLAAGSGDDTYTYARGSGHDVLVETSGQGSADKLVMTGLALSDVSISRQGGDLIISVPESSLGAGDSGSIRVKDTLLDDDAGIESFEFTDWNYSKADMRSILLSQSATSGDDIIEGFTNTADYLEGGDGDDTFVFGANFGWDTIADFEAGAGSDDVLEFRDGIFADFEAVLAAASEVGNDTIINVDGTNGITLANVKLQDLHPDDVRLVA